LARQFPQPLPRDVFVLSNAFGFRFTPMDIEYLVAGAAPREALDSSALRDALQVVSNGFYPSRGETHEGSGWSKPERQTPVEAKGMDEWAGSDQNWLLPEEEEGEVEEDPSTRSVSNSDSSDDSSS
jgi:hypothetical protein